MRARSSHIRLPSCWLSAIQNWPPVGPEKALKEFDKALASLPPQLEHVRCQWWRPPALYCARQ
jgi:hypothetical protein